jgi:hypothetical protein
MAAMTFMTFTAANGHTNLYPMGRAGSSGRRVVRPFANRGTLL